jgi:hypothetical protein
MFSALRDDFEVLLSALYISMLFMVYVILDILLVLVYPCTVVELPVPLHPRQRGFSAHPAPTTVFEW